MKIAFTIAVFVAGLSLGILIGRFAPNVGGWLERRVRAWKVRRAYRPKPYEEFTPEHHRFASSPPITTMCDKCAHSENHPIHLHPCKVWSAEELDYYHDSFPLPVPGTIDAVLHAASTVDWHVKLYTLEDRWPGVLFVEPGDLTDDHLSLLKAIERHRCMGVLVRLVGCATPELPPMNFHEEEV
jgi:hypothetical protein